MDPILLKDSFNMIAPHKEEFARRFYTQLFKQYPQTRRLFASTVEEMFQQESLLVATLAVIIAGVERGENLTEVIHSPEAHHGSYGAQPAQDSIVGALLIQTFQDMLGERFTSQMKEAWSQAYEIMSVEILKEAGQYASPRE